MEEQHGACVFYELPLEIHPLILLHLDVQSVGRAFCVCKLWASFATDSFLNTLCTERLGWKTQFKPHGRDWKWVIMSKRSLGPEVLDPDGKLCGVGSRVCLFVYTFTTYILLTNYRLFLMVFTKENGKILNETELVAGSFLQ